MSEELNLKTLKKDFANWDFRILGATSIKQLKESKLIEDKVYAGVENKKPDGLILENKKVIAIIEGKTPSQFGTKKLKEKAVKQELIAAQKLGAKLLIVTDTHKTLWCNVLRKGELIKNEKGEILKYNFKDLASDQLENLIVEINDSIDTKNSQIKPKKQRDPTDLAKSIWQDIWSVSGATPENCLYTFVELFIFKYLSDLEILHDPEDFDSLMSLYEKRNNNYVLEFYVNTIRKKIKYDLFPENNKDGTTIINGTIFVSKDEKAVEGYSSVFKKVLEKFKNYGKLENISYDFKSKLFESFLKESISKKNWGQFFTPLKVVRAVCKMFSIDEYYNKTICDPACGVGKFLLEPVLKDLNKFFEVRNGKLISHINLAGFDKGFDTEEQKTIILANANMLIYFSDLIKKNSKITKQFSKLFNNSFELKTNSILGTLKYPIVEKYDLILTNPPYVTSGSSNLKDEISKDNELKNHFAVNALGVEGLFMEWIIKALKKGGKAFIVIPDGILNRINDKKLRKYILDECFVDAIISLPAKTFFTTIKKTYILAITKKIDKTQVQKDPVFTYLVTDIGETLDVYRFDTNKSDLEEGVRLFNQFKNAKNYFSTKDCRCKVTPIKKFYDDFDKHWSIDRWWSHEEKIKLGIEEKQDEVDLEGFSELIENMSTKIEEHKAQINEIKQGVSDLNDNKEFKITELLVPQTIPKKITRKDILIKGKYPVYSSQFDNNGCVGYLDNHMFSPSKEDIYFTFGDHTKSLFQRHEPFSVLDNVKVLKLNKDFIGKIDLNYVKYTWLNLIPNLGYARHWKEAKNIKIKIPLDGNGKIDLKKQKEYSEKYVCIDFIKAELHSQVESFVKTNVNLES